MRWVFWIGLKRLSTQGSDVTTMTVHIFQDGGRTKSLPTWISTEDGYYIYSRFLLFSVNSVVIHRQNNIVISVGSHFVLIRALQLE